MKRQRLVSSFTPALQEWLEEELENRGVDSVYARSILSLLQQDYVDVEPHEYQNPRNHQHRVLYKYGGAENLSYASKSKHQKWKTWGKHILTSASPCRKAAYYDLERLLKKAAVDCLKSASDYAYDIEELIDEVWIKLKSKSLKGEQEEIALRNRNPLGHSFFIPPSPTDEIEKYFAAFPPLSSKNECAVETAKHKILRNAWCKNCNLKRKSNVQDEEALNAENQKFHSNKIVQPIIPYRSLKTIKNIFKNSCFKSPWKASYAQHGTVSKRAVIYGVKSFKLPAIIEDSLLSLSNLTSANIHEISLNKIELLTLLKDVGVKNVLLFCNEPGISKETSVAKSSFIRSNEPSLCVLEEESSDLIIFPKAMNPEDNSKKYAAGHITSSGAFSEENSLTDAKGLSDYHGIDIHFRMSPLADLLEYKSPCLETNDGSAAVPESVRSVETLKYYLSEMSNSFNTDNSELYTQPDAVINCLESENSTVRRENALTCYKFNSYFVGESQVHSLNSSRALDIQSDLYSQNANFSIKQSFNPLDIINTSHVETSLFFSDTESDKHVESMASSNFESCCSDDEIYYSDDDSNEIFRSENKENSNFSDLPFQHTEQNCVLNKFSEDTLAETEIEGASVSEPNQYNLIFGNDSEERSVLDNNEFKHDETEHKLLKVLNLASDNLNFINVKSTCKKLPFISYSQSESVDKNYVTERNANYEYFPNIFDEMRSGLPVENHSLAESNISDKVVASSASKCTAGAGQKSSEIDDKKWLFYWGNNHNFIARTWQKDFVPVEAKESKEQLFYDAKISTALCKEIKEEENYTVRKENALACHKFDSYFVGESQVHSLNSSRALDIQSDLYSQNANFSIKQSFNPLDIIKTSHVETSLFFSDTESDKHVESIASSNFESCCSDDEIYYSDDDSNEIFRSENKENSNFSDLPFQHTEQNCVLNKFSEDTLAETEIEGASVSEPNQYNLIFSVDSEERSVLDNNEFKHDETEHKLLKVLNLASDNLNFINVKSTCKKLPFISYSQSESVDKNYVTELNANYEYFPNIFDEMGSGLPVENHSLAESNISDKVVASSASKCTAGAGQKSSEIDDKKWLFYWGDNHNFIARTWQKDFVPVEEKESKEQLFYDAKISTALCKEIKEEEDELLKGLCSVPTIGSTVFVNELCKLKQNDLHSSHLPSQIENLSNGCEEKTSLYVQVPESHKVAVNQVENYIPIMNNNFTFDNIENNVPVMQCTGDYSVSFENNPFKAANFPDLSAFSNASEENGSFKDYYMEGGGWSLASDSVADYYCDNPYERSCSMSDLDLEKSNNDYLEFFYQKRQRCTSETDDVEMTGYNDAPNPYKKSKQKLAPKKKPCCFFLQGTCTRSDCRYSHDLSTITCRFWSEGSCFKGPTCPFLHGYLPENDERPLQDDAYLRSHSPDLSYSLESEADFPSLSSSKSEEPRVKSEAINIPFVKGSKKKRKEK
ncbi:unnamed protein product [Larinioides sclopetarius]|uniref:C3H1-type domain-containing protein n=1 Tax=Larinioides sclopetarius TaxID=280406 RepID=A0AAV2BCL8_9ARAC